MSPVLEWAAGSAAGSPAVVLLPDWKAITEIRIGTARGTRLAFREAAIKMEPSGGPGTAPPGSVRFLQKKSSSGTSNDDEGNMKFQFNVLIRGRFLRSDAIQNDLLLLFFSFPKM